jgi:hypothetical protein
VVDQHENPGKLVAGDAVAMPREAVQASDED